MPDATLPAWTTRVDGAGRMHVIILGAGGFARETARAIDAASSSGSPLRLAGYADDRQELAGTSVDGVPVLGTIDQVAGDADARFVIGAGRPDNYVSRLRIAHRLGLPRERYATVVHPSCELTRDTEIGAGTVLLASVVATASVRVGDHVAVMPGVILTHDDEIADYVTLASGVRVGGNVSIGRGAYLGAGTLVRESISIGAWAMIGMGSVVTRDVPSGELWLGAPARFHRRAPVPDDVLEAAS